MAAVVGYSAPWWVTVLHRLPHFNLHFEQTASDFRPADPTYQESIALLGGIALACLALDLLFLLFYSFWLCCRRSKTRESTRADCCCTAWCVIVATLVCSAGIAVGFYGNSETCDGVTRLTYSLRHANRTVTGGCRNCVRRLVPPSTRRPRATCSSSRCKYADPHGLPVHHPEAPDPAGGSWCARWPAPLVGQRTAVSLEALADQIELYDWYRWLGYLGLLLFDVLICLLVLFGLIRNSKGTLIGVCLFGVLALVISWATLGLELAVSATASDFCISPQPYVTAVAAEYGNILQYYLTCNVEQVNPFQQDYVQAVTGLCYDGLEGLIYLLFFSSSRRSCSPPWCAASRTPGTAKGAREGRRRRGRLAGPGGGRQNHENRYRVHMPTVSCGSSYGSEASIRRRRTPAQNANFPNPRCENTPLIGRESPPPSYTSSMRAKYLASSPPEPEEPAAH
ncbi:hypothetical protein CRUP_028651 [Coryphaenoides rupestris]|nr:hypothetical protein CRUP_028651 [Coryphaenoides rupestris]